MSSPGLVQSYDMPLWSLSLIVNFCLIVLPTVRHHNYIDRLWWQWQQADGANRLFWISGNTVNETLYPSQIGVNATLDYVLQLSDIVPDVKAVEVMNAQGGFLCYDYDY